MPAPHRVGRTRRRSRGAGPLLLLDTHVWVWVLEGVEGELAPACVKAVERAADGGGLRVSAISVWEVATLEAGGRLRFTVDIEEWVRRALGAPGLRLVGLEPEIAVESTRLPGRLHGDPADRILVATARRIGATLATRDRRLLDYGGAGHLSILDARP